MIASITTHGRVHDRSHGDVYGPDHGRVLDRLWTRLCTGL